MCIFSKAENPNTLNHARDHELRLRFRKVPVMDHMKSQIPAAKEIEPEVQKLPILEREPHVHNELRINLLQNIQLVEYRLDRVFRNDPVFKLRAWNYLTLEIFLMARCLLVFRIWTWKTLPKPPRPMTFSQVKSLFEICLDLLALFFFANGRSSFPFCGFVY